MLYRWLADAVVVIHLGFILFVAVGGLLAWRWRKILWAHVPSVVWGIGIVWLGFDCPLTPLERNLRGRGGEGAYEESFVDRYVEGVVYPEQYTPHLRTLAAALIIVAWARLAWPALTRWRRAPGAPAGSLSPSSERRHGSS